MPYALTYHSIDVIIFRVFNIEFVRLTAKQWGHVEPFVYLLSHHRKKEKHRHTKDHNNKHEHTIAIVHARRHTATAMNASIGLCLALGSEAVQCVDN